MTKLIGLIVATLAACLAVPLLSAAAILGGVTCAPAATPSSAATSPGQPPTVDGWNTEQVSHLATIITVSTTKDVPPWGWVVAVATAIQVRPAQPHRWRRQAIRLAEARAVPLGLPTVPVRRATS